MNSMTAYYKGKPNYTFTLMPPGMYDQTASQAVAQTYFTANKNVNVFATFGDQMAQGALTAMKLVGGYTPGKNIQIIGYGGAKEIVNEVKAGTVYATLGLYPTSESVLGIQSLNDALTGQAGADPDPHHQPGHPTGDHRPGVPERAPELRSPTGRSRARHHR